MPNKFKKIIMPVIIAVSCIAVLVTVLVLTLTGKESGGHIIIDGGVHTVKGEIDISLVRERLDSWTIDPDTTLPVRKTDENIKDFSKSNENVFGIDSNLFIAPGCYFSAEMIISNKKPYPFEYWLEIIPENGESLLADQLELTVTVDGEEFIKRSLKSGLNTKVFPAVEEGHTAKFTVKLEYIDSEDNDRTKNSTLAFDMIVHAKLTES